MKFLPLASDYKNLSDGVFKAELSELDCSQVTENKEVNLGLKTFVQLINRILDKHAPTKIIEKKKKRKEILNHG